MLKARNIELVVFDMAGTTVDEGGVVYQTLARVMKEAGATFSQQDFDHWHGANKIEVVRHFLTGASEADVQKVYGQFQHDLEEAYFSDHSGVKPIDGALDCFHRLRSSGIKVALDTGYPNALAERLIAKVGFGPCIDGNITSEDVGAGRPYPYMIHALMKRFGLMDVRKVAKAGDTVRDIEEGLNAGCGLVIGVESGADSRETLGRAGAHMVLPSVAKLEV